MLLMKADVCPVCYELKSSVIQLGLGLGYPMVLGPVAALLVTYLFYFYSRYNYFLKLNKYRFLTWLLSVTLFLLVPNILFYFQFANRYSTFRVPQLNEGPKKMLKFLQKITKPFNGTLAVIAVAQFLGSSFVTYFEMRNNLSLRKKMLAVEEKFIREQELKHRWLIG